MDKVTEWGYSSVHEVCNNTVHLWIRTRTLDNGVSWNEFTTTHQPTRKGIDFIKPEANCGYLIGGGDDAWVLKKKFGISLDNYKIPDQDVWSLDSLLEAEKHHKERQEKIAKMMERNIV